MPEQPSHPQPPAGFQRPGIPGAGNILDPAVRGELREKIHEAVHGAASQGGDPPSEAPQTDAAPAAKYRAGPYPHGDVDLRGFAANVPPGPVRPQRGRGGRRFYFLRESEPPTAAPSNPPAVRAPEARKPG
jgi:hypothetical protein